MRVDFNSEEFITQVRQALEMRHLQDDGVMPVTLAFIPRPSCQGVDNVCDWYYAAPEDRPTICPTCGEEFE